VHAGDVVLLREDPHSEDPATYRVAEVRPDVALDQTTARMVPFDGNYQEGRWDAPLHWLDLTEVARSVKPARATVAPPPARSLEAIFDAGEAVSLFENLQISDKNSHDSELQRVVGESLRERPGLLRLLAYDSPPLRDSLSAGLRGAAPPAPPPTHVLRATAQVFGHNAPQKATVTQKTEGQPPVTSTTTTYAEWQAADDEDDRVMFLDGDFPTIQEGDHIVVHLVQSGVEELPTFIRKVTAVSIRSRQAYGLSGKTTRLTLLDPWWDPVVPGGELQPAIRQEITAIRNAVVYVRSEPLVLVGEPIQGDVSDSFIDVDGIIDGLEAGRWLLVEGERTDLEGVSGMHAAELARVAYAETRIIEDAVEDGGDESATAPYTRIHLVEPLSYKYKRASVVVRGNVTHATHGETRDDVLGSGNASEPDQRFELRQSPRTWVSAPTPTGVASTLEVRANGVLWPEVRSFVGLGPRDEVVVTRTTGEGRDEVKGGDGHRGARFPTGVENLMARYRVGLGAAGNVGAGRITTLVTRPMGVQEVTNPLRASGGADADGRDEIRERIPIAARAIDRLVSVQDHADFALNFAGVDKAGAWLAADPHGGATVTVVIAGDEDVPIDETSDLFRNLREAFHRYGDPSTRIRLKVAENVPLVLQAKVRLDPRHTWSHVEPALREALYARHGWAARAIGEAAWLSRVLEVMQSVAGVRSVDVDIFGPLHSYTFAAPAEDPGDAEGAEDALGTRIRNRLLGLIERLIESKDGERVWSFAAAPDQILYFARSLPEAVSLLEVTP
jgi:hypothetical protein